MIVPGDHVFRPKIHEGDEMNAGDFLNVALVALRNGMCEGCARHERQGNEK